ncbi:MAG TPA: NAD-dependent epimerase/dehydratase family protein [Polyangiaceae bacterium]|nr:NAD-dependent epimerase/dehydratase family protein [Polyangiaceae bacterium]
MQNPWILVTGATGLIGGTLVRKLVERGEKVKAFVRAGSDLRGLEGLPNDRCQLAFGDATIEHTVYRALASCSQLYHVAGPFQYMPAHPQQLIDDGRYQMRAVLGAARRRGIENIVVTSSTAVLGTSSVAEPIDETHGYNLVDAEPYVQAKVAADEVVQEFVADGMPVVSVLPAGVFGPRDYKPTPNGQSLIEYLKLPPTFSVPVSEGGISVVDVEDVVNGHIRAMEVGDVGERYILGGENVTYTQFFQMLADITGLAEPSDPKGPLAISLVAWFAELKAELTGSRPALTTRLARDYAHAYVWVTSEKAEQALGYQHRPARETLARATRWLLEHGYVPSKVAERVRLELRPV